MKYNWRLEVEGYNDWVDVRRRGDVLPLTVLAAAVNYTDFIELPMFVYQKQILSFNPGVYPCYKQISIMPGDPAILVPTGGDDYYHNGVYHILYDVFMWDDSTSEWVQVNSVIEIFDTDHPEHFRTISEAPTEDPFA